MYIKSLYFVVFVIISDCTRDCGQFGGALSDDCGYCNCTGQQTIGSVKDSSTNAPLEGVSVTVLGYEWESLATTDANGEYSFSDVCNIGLTVVFTKDGYVRKTVPVNMLVNDNTSVADAMLDPVGKKIKSKVELES